MFHLWVTIMADLGELKERLLGRAEEVCAHLLPEGRRDGHEWRCGSIRGEKGKSFGVNLTTGVFADFAGDNKGDNLLELWRQARGHGTVGPSAKEAAQWLGIPGGGVSAGRFEGAASAYGGRQRRRERPVVDRGGEAPWCPVKEGSRIWRWLTERRGIPAEVIRRYGVGETLDEKRAVWPYFNLPEAPEDPEWLVEAPAALWEKEAWVKFRWVGGELDRQTYTTKGAAHLKCLWGKPAVPEGAKAVVICEGEVDAMSWAARGIAAVSVPFGAKWRGENGEASPNRDWIENDFQWLNGFDTIFVAMDMDDPGRRAGLDMVRELGRRRCRLVALPEGFKDANEMLLAGVEASGFEECLERARDFAPDKVRRPGEFREEVLEDLLGEGDEPGEAIPFTGAFRVRMGELTVVTGDSGHGKTKQLNHLGLHLMSRGLRTCVASFEVKSRRLLLDMMRCAVGQRLWKAEMGEGEDAALAKRGLEKNVDRTLAWLDGRLWVYDHTGIAQWETFLEDFRWVAKRHGVRVFIIDSLMRCGILEDDYAGQSAFVTRLAAWAQELDVHVFLVAHGKKGEKGERDRSIGGDKSNVSGSAKIVANAHNVVEIWRNIRKGQEVADVWERWRVGQMSLEDRDEALKKQKLNEDAKFIVRKQRDGEVQDGSFRLYFIWEAYQFTPHPPSSKDWTVSQYVPDLNEAALPKVFW